jgi:hypothetical protein
MFALQWLHGLERLGHEVLFIDLVNSDFQERRERVRHAFDQVIQKWWHTYLTSLMVVRRSIRSTALEPQRFPVLRRKAPR